MILIMNLNLSKHFNILSVNESHQLISSKAQTNTEIQRKNRYIEYLYLYLSIYLYIYLFIYFLVFIDTNLYSYAMLFSDSCFTVLILFIFLQKEFLNIRTLPYFPFNSLWSYSIVKKILHQTILYILIRKTGIIFFNCYK